MTVELPEELRYTDSDEWVRREGDELVSGITAFAADQLGDVVYLQLPEVGRRLGKGDPYGEIESVKAVSELNMPIGGEVTNTNAELDQQPGLVNDDPYGRGWILKLRPDDPSAFAELMDAGAYRRNIEERS